MKKIIIIGLFFVGCKKEPIAVAPSTCNCYETHERWEAIQGPVSGTLSVGWVYDFTTTTQPDLCSKETNEFVYTGYQNQYRYKVKCN